jgi:hypothetical protein
MRIVLRGRCGDDLDAIGGTCCLAHVTSHALYQCDDRDLYLMLCRLDQYHRCNSHHLETQASRHSLQRLCHKNGCVCLAVLHKFYFDSVAYFSQIPRSTINAMIA